ncbi:MAG TPA: hypothetical protein VFD92_08545 [Candidatus Binatia bacterium]|nr:hypothetical protein [Candidatus Binatia bacterium]
MNLENLGHDERIALVALLEFVGESNAEMTDEESERIAHVAEHLGSERYREIAREADERCRDEQSLRAVLRSVARQDARELIYATALDVAAGDAIQKREAELLDWLAAEWQIAVTFDEPEEDD